MSLESRLSACARQVRRYDHDRYLTALFAPADRREALFALAAFNLEIAKIREVVTEPMLGEMRLQWWREALDGIADGQVRKHEVVEPLAAATRQFDLPIRDLHRIIKARAFDLEECTSAIPGDYGLPVVVDAALTRQPEIALPGTKRGDQGFLNN